jgi:hypothetical protein
MMIHKLNLTDQEYRTFLDCVTLSLTQLPHNSPQFEGASNLLTAAQVQNPYSALESKKGCKPTKMIRPQYKGLTLPTIISRLLFEHRSTLTATELTQLIYQAETQEDFDRARNSLSDTLRFGAKAGKWKKIGRNGYRLSGSKIKAVPAPPPKPRTEPYEILGANNSQFVCHATSPDDAIDQYQALFPGEEFYSFRAIRPENNPAQFQCGETVVTGEGDVVTIVESKMLELKEEGRVVGIERHYRTSLDADTWLPEHELSVWIPESERQPQVMEAIAA